MIHRGVVRGKAIIFIPKAASYPVGFENMVESIRQFVATEIVRSFDHLGVRLLPQAKQPRPIIIVLASSKGELESLLEAKALFRNTRLILLLADADEETVALGHRMEPRFIGYLTDGLGEVPAVVRKMAAGESRPRGSARERRFWA